jgi:hypothetical protein
MDIQDMLPGSPTMPRGSLALVNDGKGNCQQSAASWFMRVSEVDRECAPTSPRTCLLNWLRQFVARPHPMLGRKGSVCPVVPTALASDSIWITEIIEDNPSVESISAIITECRNVFLSTEPKNGPDAINKAFLVAFPSLGDHGSDGAAVIDKVQCNLKKYFVDMGLMLGEFHAANDSPGLRNPEFRPLRSPVPMLAIRHMVESDLPFLTRESYPANERSSFLRSYLFRLGGSLSQVKFDEALNCLIAAEIALLIAKTLSGEITILSTMHDSANESDDRVKRRQEECRQVRG